MSPQPHKGERIGIIEDDLVVGGTLAHRLELEGYMPLWWRTGQEALEGLHTRPDLVVCDIVLPDMSGEDVFLQALPQLGGKPFLFVTGFGKVEDAVRLMKAGGGDAPSRNAAEAGRRYRQLAPHNRRERSRQGGSGEVRSSNFDTRR